MSAPQWKPVHGYEGLYEISSLGEVRRVPRKVKCANGTVRNLRRRLLKVSLGSDGYLKIGLTKKGTRKTLHVHALVLRSFVGKRPVDKEVRHLDGDKTNNVLSNLRYGTKEENEADKRSHGNLPSSLNPAQVRRVRDLYLQGTYTQKVLARKFGVSEDTIHNIVKGKSWWHLSDSEFSCSDNRATLTAGQVRAIRKRYAGGNITMVALSKAYGVSDRQISNIVHSKNWRDT